MEILLSVSYIVNVEKEQFWNKDTGTLHPKMLEELQKQFPSDISLPGGLQGHQSKLFYIPLGMGHSEKCPLCQRWMTTEPGYYSALPLAWKIGKSLYCDSCAYDVHLDESHPKQLS